MLAFLALVMHEIRERRALVVAAAVASILPVLAPILAGPGSNSPEDIREVAMWVMVCGLVPLFALMLGVSFIGRDLAEGRLGFYFSQPLAGPTIWFGKLTAVVLLLWVAQVVIMLPTVLFAPGRLHLLAPKGPLGPYDPLWFTVLPLWLGPIAVLLLAHAVGTLWRARSAWVGVDLVSLLAVVGGAWILFRPFFFRFSAKVAEIGLLWLVAILMLGLTVGGAIQMVSGRVDPRRGHRALSLTLWSILITGVATLGGWTWWIRSATPSDLSEVRQVAVGAADWIAVMGPSPGRVDYQPRFVINISDARWLRADSSNLWNMRDMVFARNGGRAVWLSPITFGSSKLMVADLDEVAPEGRASGLDFNVFVKHISLSDDGGRVAVIQDTTVMVFDLDNRSQLAAAQIDGDFKPHRLIFEDRDRIRIESIDSTKKVAERWRFQTRYLDIARKSLSEGGEPRIHFYRKTLARGDESSLVSFYDVSKEEQRLILVDEVTGERIAELGKMTNWSNIRVVGDRLVVFRWGADGERIEIFDGHGELRHQIELNDIGAIFDGGEITENRIIVGFWTWDSDEGPSPRLETAIIDVAEGVSEEVLHDYAPVMGLWETNTSTGAWDTGSTASRVLRGEDRSLHLWDPETGELEQLIPVVE
jgi:hypothetical protein